uniref:Uncharacterized protein n=1 Tax=Parascaris equorum TaxID=6256 RepID=A0A914R9C1_PAREQ
MTEQSNGTERREVMPRYPFPLWAHPIHLFHSDSMSTR